MAKQALRMANEVEAAEARNPTGMPPKPDKAMRRHTGARNLSGLEPPLWLMDES
jgi:hypothetical protein